MTTTTSLYHTFVKERTYLRNVTGATVKYYQFAWKVLEPFMPQDPREISRVSIVEAIQALKSHHSDNSINGYLRALRAFVRWCQQCDYPVDPKLKVELMRTDQPLIKTFTPAHVRAMLSLDARSLDQRRVQAMLALALDTGIRIQELLDLKVEDLRMDDLIVRVWGKGRKERLVPMSPEGRKRVWAWLKHRPTCEEGWVWSTKRETRITKRNSYRDLKALARKVGVEGVRVSWHTFRHTFATEYAKAGGNVLYLQAILGHTDLKMTRRYVSVAPETVASAHVGLSIVQKLGR